MIAKRQALFLGMDGGGSKTACALMNARGQVLAQTEGIGISYRQHGVDLVMRTIAQLKEDCLHKAGADAAALVGICLGMPAYGENTEMDQELYTRLNSTYANLLLVNDVHVGWAGSLALGSGVNLVSGTGSIAYGMNARGQSARSGGWSEHIGDEGSSYWLALKGMQLFTKQADHRKPKGPLYHLIREELQFENDFDFINIVEEHYLPYRDKTARFHYLVARAAKEGDLEVIRLYEEAAEELFSITQAVLDQLGMQAEGSLVSYSGGTFRVGEVLLDPLRALFDAQGTRMVEPLYSPVVGALLLSVQKFAPQDLAQVLDGLNKNKQRA